MDAVHRPTNTCVEFKTSESTKVVKEPYSYHIKQLLMYQSILNSKRGVLLYLILGASHRVSNHFPEYQIVMTEEDRKRILQKIEEDATQLQYAIDNNLPNLAELYLTHLVI